MLSVLGFLIILGPLVVVHEFGHYLFARIFNVKAETFSIGFGPKLWSKQLGETELRVSIVPLGGYVKLLGEDREAELTPEEAKRALHKAPAWKRFFIFFGGPLFNFLFAIIVFMAILVIGEPQVASVAGRVVRHSPAEQAGFRSGDKILSVNGKPVRLFEDVLSIVAESPNKTVDFEVMHPGASSAVHLTATPTPESGYSIYGESKSVGEIDGLFANARSTLIGVSDPESLAGKAGVKTGDSVAAVNGAPVTTWEEIENLYDGAAAGSNFDLKITKAAGGTADVSIKAGADKERESLGNLSGLRSSELFVEKTVPKSPAEGAGVQPGDRLVGVGDTRVQSFFQLKDAVQHAGETEGKVRLHWERQGKELEQAITPTATAGRDPVLKKTTQFTVGVMPMLSLAEPATVIERVWNPFVLLARATERMVTFSWRNLVSVGKMIAGEVSVNTLGGPIMIGKIAGESITRGLISFLNTMAILSIGLGVLNVLPVPVLDGGHLMLLAIEAIRGKPLTMRTMEIIQGVGLFLILALMIVVLHNDLARLAS
jgi:regulator of sigma E protease